MAWKGRVGESAGVNVGETRVCRGQLTDSGERIPICSGAVPPFFRTEGRGKKKGRGCCGFVEMIRIDGPG